MNRLPEQLKTIYSPALFASIEPERQARSLRNYLIATPLLCLLLVALTVPGSRQPLGMLAALGGSPSPACWVYCSSGEGRRTLPPLCS